MVIETIAAAGTILDVIEKGRKFFEKENIENWPIEDVEVTSDFPTLAIEKGILKGTRDDYGWAHVEKAGNAFLLDEGVIFVIKKGVKTRYRPVSGKSILIKRTKK